jgi:hypothetical protein
MKNKLSIILEMIAGASFWGGSHTPSSDWKLKPYVLHNLLKIEESLFESLFEQGHSDFGAQALNHFVIIVIY